jgi:hypothetical protein
VDQETSFLITIGGFCAQVFMLAAFYYATFRRLFLNPTSNNLLMIVLLLVFFQIGYPITWIWGWINCQARKTAWVMTFWTLANGVFFLQIAAISSSTDQSGSEVGISLLATLAIAGLTLWGLVPFFRIDERMRNMVQDPTEKRIADFVTLGKDTLPEVEMLLTDDFQPTRLVAIECLSKLGSAARSLLEKASHDADPVIADAAQDALEKLDTGTAA